MSSQFVCPHMRQAIHNHGRASGLPSVLALVSTLGSQIHTKLIIPRPVGLVSFVHHVSICSGTAPSQSAILLLEGRT